MNEPNEPGQPSEPGKPSGQPSEPGQPSKQRQAGQPREPGQPSGQPSEPGQPRETDQPGQPRGQRSGYLRRVGTVALILAALATGRAVTTAFDADDSLSSPFLRSGTVGSAVALRYADVTADRVEGSTCVSVGLGATGGMRTTGVFVVVPMVIVGKGQPAEVRYAALRDRQGRTFVATGSRGSFSPGPAQPGMPRYASVVVEVPQDAVAGLHLRIALDALDQRRDDMADIDLGLGAADLAEWVRSPQIPVPAASDRRPDLTGSSLTCEVRS